jgi:hypothetical protein
MSFNDSPYLSPMIGAHTRGATIKVVLRTDA